MKKNTNTKATAVTSNGKKTAAAAGSKPAAKSKTKKVSARAEKEQPMLKEFFMDALKDIYWAENHLVKTLPKMEKAATTEELKEAITNHLEETRGQVERLEKVFKQLGEKAEGKKCKAMEGLTKEGDEIIEETVKGSYTRDVAIIIAAQKVEHYEIATYGSLVQLAYTLGENEVASLLEETLNEEKMADDTLTHIAEGGINDEAEIESDARSEKK